MRKEYDFSSAVKSPYIDRRNEQIKAFPDDASNGHDLRVLEYKEYYARIEFDAADALYNGNVLDIADSLNFHGKTVSEAEQVFHQCIDNYLVMCAAAGKAPDAITE